MQLLKNEDSVEIAYSIKESYQGRGYGTRACAIGTKLALMHSKNVILRIRDDNIASRKVALKNGFIETGAYKFENMARTGTVKMITYKLSKSI